MATKAKGIGHARGRRNGAARLTEDAVRYIRQHYRPNPRNHSNGGALAAKFGVTRRTINAVYHGEQWGWLD
jgi:poly(3-hydroxybutyrate) depolymerase